MSDVLFFRHHAADPFFNMAFDECMLALALSRPGALLLRLYSWQPGAITFGYNQRRDTALDFGRVGDTPVIRRITGGRAVYHDVSELTYSIAVNPHTAGRAGLGGTTAAIYRRLSQSIAIFLESIGISSELVARSSPENSRPDFFHKAPCFASSARHEIISEGRKLVASAQRQIQGVILQHGSIKVSGLATHPALGPALPGSRSDLQPLEKKQFEVFAQAFAETMGAELGVVFESVNELPGMASNLKERVCEVTKNALERRDMIKQTTGPNSL